MMRQGEFIGFDNFTRLFADKFFITAVGNTWLLWLLNFIPQMGIAMLLSVWFTSPRLRLKGVGTWRALFYLPNLLMPAAIAGLYQSLFDFYGPVNQFLVRSDILPQAMHFMQNVGVTRGLVVFIQWWMWFGQTIIILMAGMTSIPISLYEAAMVDGASGWQMFRRITLPLLKPILVFIFVTSLVGGMQLFDIPFLLTDGRGAPQNALLTSIVLLYTKFGSSKGHIGAAASVGTLVFIMTSVVALGIFYFMRDKDNWTSEKEKAEKKARKGLAKRVLTR
jgi:multiple sugar transport system permease protein